MNAAHELSREVLMRWQDFDWTVQGLGMLRTYLSGDKFRLHIWDSRLATPGVSTIHDHPWDFESTVIAGLVRNRRYLKTASLFDDEYMEQSIVCGPGGGVCASPERVRLMPLGVEAIQADSFAPTYTQRADEIHESMPAPGSVTLIERTFHENTEVAHVYYPAGGEWVSAEPRPATEEEASVVINFSLGRWFS